mmetsp:Transcript_45537/g.134659  ORF Transcript_45537/g.134659 Transcript_45537/m.134659 type:complete len:208 (+) Transcript_45537:1016-1639(+)
MNAPGPSRSGGLAASSCDDVRATEPSRMMLTSDLPPSRPSMPYRGLCFRWPSTRRALSTCSLSPDSIGAARSTSMYVGVASKSARRTPSRLAVASDLLASHAAMASVGCGSSSSCTKSHSDCDAARAAASRGCATRSSGSPLSTPATSDGWCDMEPLHWLRASRSGARGVHVLSNATIAVGKFARERTMHGWRRPKRGLSLEAPLAL